MKWLLLGLRLAFSDPRLRPFVWKPVAISVLIYFTLLLGGFALIVPLMARLTTSIGAPAWLGGGAGAILWGVIWWFLSAPIFLTVMCTVSAHLWDPLSRQVEEMRTGVPAQPGLPRSMAMMDMGMRIPFAILVSLLILAIGWIGFGLVGAAFAGFLGILDFTSPALGRRGHLLPTQFFKVFKLKGGFTFWLGVAAVSILPFLHAFLFPAWVVGGTIMVVESERDGRL